MREPAFTPGPWKHRATLNPHRSDGASWREIEDENGCIIGEVFHDQDEDEPFILDETAEANARLIAAAPALYEALRRVMDTYGFDPSIGSGIWNEAAEALSLALGESPNA